MSSTRTVPRSRKIAPAVGLAMRGIYAPNARTFVASPFFWIGGPQNLLCSLFTGNTIVTQPRFDPDAAVELIERERCTGVAATATLQRTLEDHPGYQRRNLSSLTADRRSPFRSRLGPPHELRDDRDVRAPFPAALFDYRVVDRDTGASLPDGEEGEFCVRGHALMAGLYKREREETFDSDGYYHTGDRGYIEDGRIFFTGRYSEMIKTGGANVSPA